MLPDFAVVDIGVRCIYGKVPLTPAVRSLVPQAFLRGFSFVTDGRGVGAAFAPVLFRTPPEEYGDYLMAVLTATNAVLGCSDEELFEMSPADLWSIVTRLTGSWHPTVRSLVDGAEVDAAFPITLRTCTRVAPWPAGRVALLGDAIHPMAPAAGAGANTALWDAACLTRALTGELGLAEALTSYQRAMIPNGQTAATKSLQNAERLFHVDI